MIADDIPSRAPAHWLRALAETIGRRRCTWLLGSMVTLLLLYPYLDAGRGPVGLTVEVLVSAVLLTGLYAVSRRPWTAAVAVLLLVPSLLGTWASSGHGLERLAVASEIAFLGFVTATVFSYVMSDRLLVGERLQGALSVYLLVGVLFASIYELLELTSPGSLLLPAGAPQWGDLVYFSFVTLTTLGYGDVLPVTLEARSLAVLEATAGVLYLAVLVAWLVGALGIGRGGR